jgi:NaMN:DMB phosphoribosyltransferase
MVLENAIFCHSSAEQAHQKILDFLNVRSVLQLDLRLGENGLRSGFSHFGIGSCFFKRYGQF